MEVDKRSGFNLLRMYEGYSVNSRELPVDPRIW